MGAIFRKQSRHVIVYKREAQHELLIRLHVHQGNDIPLEHREQGPCPGGGFTWKGACGWVGGEGASWDRRDGVGGAGGGKRQELGEDQWTSGNGTRGCLHPSP